jgi:hypothetical protein
MKSLFATFASILLILALTACGSASKDTASNLQRSVKATTTVSSPTTTTAVPAGGYLKEDGDPDSDDKPNSNKRSLNDDASLLDAYGKKAGSTERQAVTRVVKSYYAAATGDNGAKACALLSASLIAGLAEGASESAGSVHNECAATVSSLFKQQHRLLASEGAATVVVTAVHIKGDVGLVLLGFRSGPESEILIQRDGHTWKVNALFDSELP